jgi:hypothetical protein
MAASLLAAAMALGGHCPPRQFHCTALRDEIRNLQLQDRWVVNELQTALDWADAPETAVFPNVPFFNPLVQISGTLELASRSGIP